MPERTRVIKVEITAGDVMCESCEFADNNLQMCTIFLESIKIGRTKDCLDGEVEIGRMKDYLDEEIKVPSTFEEETI